jgi:hypothetical protein
MPLGTSTLEPLVLHLILWLRMENFDTAECGNTWKETQCLSCHHHSPHSDWYHQFGGNPVEEAVEQKVREVIEVGE